MTVLLRTRPLDGDAQPGSGGVVTDDHERSRRGSVATVRASRLGESRFGEPRFGEPRYELRLIRGDASDAPVLVWSRHRLRWLAERSLRLEEAHLRIAPARLVVVDRRADRAAGKA